MIRALRRTSGRSSSGLAHFLKQPLTPGDGIAMMDGCLTESLVRERSPMGNDTNLSGRWVGNYYQHNRPHPISLELIQDGESLTGSMWDGETDKDISVFEAAVEAGLPPGADEQIVAQLTEAFPDAPADSIRYVTHLPAESSLEGWVRGDTVYFLKTYEGAHVGGYKVGERIVGHVIEQHCVHYQGKLDQRRGAIEGRWWIDSQGAPGTARAEGSFEFSR